MDLKAKAYIERVRAMPAEHVACVPVEYSGRVGKAFGLGYAGNVSASHLVGDRGRTVAQRASIGYDAGGGPLKSEVVIINYNFNPSRVYA